MNRLWDFKEIKRRRIQDKIIDTPIGSCPSNPRQSKILAAPFIRGKSPLFLKNTYYYCSDGLNYGAEASLSINDPALVHTKYLVFEIKDGTKDISLELVRACRIARSVGKEALIKFLCEEEVKYDATIKISVDKANLRPEEEELVQELKNSIGNYPAASREKSVIDRLEPCHYFILKRHM